METLKSTNNAFIRKFQLEVIKWRQNTSKMWSLAIIFALLIFHFITANQTFGIPFLSISFISGLFRLKLWFYFLAILFGFWLSFDFYDRLYNVSQKVYPNSSEKIIQLATSLHSAWTVANLLFTILISYMLISFYDSQEELNSTFIVGYNLFCVFIYCAEFSYSGKFTLNWPIIQRMKYDRFKNQAYKILITIVKSHFLYLIIWQFIYTTFGFLYQCTTFNDENVKEYSTYSTLFAAFKLSIIIVYSNALSWHLYEIFMTENYEFDSSLRDTNNLATAMSLNSHPYIQTLALIDFCNLSLSNSKRQKLFSLHLQNVIRDNLQFKMQRLFVDSNISYRTDSIGYIINMLKGLSNVIIASLNEDQFGVVQQSLGDIIRMLIDMQKAMEKLNASKTSFKQLQKPNPSINDLLIQKLIFVLNESIFKITYTFGSSLRSLKLEEDIMLRLQQNFISI